MSELPQQLKQWAKIVAKAWADDEYKQHLLADTATVLAEEGVEISQNKDIRIVEAKENQAVLVIPSKPTDEDAMVDEERLAAGMVSLM